MALGLVQVIFQNAGNGAQRGRGAVRQSFAAGCLQPLFAVPLFQFGQTSAGLVALLGGLTGLQEVFGYLLGHRTDRHRPAAELVSVVGEIFLVLRRHMLALRQRITLPGLQPAVAGYTAAVVEYLYRCFSHADVHALANQVIGNRILVPAIRNKIVVGDLGNRPDGRFKRTDRQRQHIGLLFFQIGTSAAASHLLERAAVQLIQLFSNCLIQFPQRKEFAVA